MESTIKEATEIATKLQEKAILTDFEALTIAAQIQHNIILSDQWKLLCCAQ